MLIQGLLVGAIGGIFAYTCKIVYEANKSDEKVIEIKNIVKDIIASFIFMLEDTRIDIRIREQYLNSCKYLKDNFYVNINR